LWLKIGLNGGIMNMTQQTELKLKDVDSSTWENPVGLDGCEFIEFAGPDAKTLHETFKKLGFVLTGNHKDKDIFFYEQGGVKFIVNEDPESFAKDFKDSHGASACAMGLKTEDAQKAYEEVLKRGATPYVDRKDVSGFNAIYGIGKSLVYFVDYKDGNPFEKDFDFNGANTKGFGLRYTDHMTNNVPVSEMQQWCDFYEKTFNFKETRFFNIKGESTGLISKVMSSPCQKLAIPINEPTDPKSQIQEYIDEYKGSGIQHIALGTDDIVETVSKMRDQGIEFLEVPDTYYDMLKTRLPNVTEDIEKLRKLRILVDGDEKGYLLQIFTKNLFGPIFIEIIQRKKHNGFGEGNFQALFDAIERDQKDRGVL
jgi:4-hydroxyphenylpyruvate dioxygenase